MNQFDYFVSGEDIPGIVYHNTLLRYPFWHSPAIRGVYSNNNPIYHHQVTLEDYRKHNPTGDFHIDSVAHEIREYFNDGSYVVVANSGI